MGRGGRLQVPSATFPDRFPPAFPDLVFIVWFYGSLVVGLNFCHVFVFLSPPPQKKKRTKDVYINNCKGCVQVIPCAIVENYF